MNLYTKEQLKLIKLKTPQSVYNRIKKVNLFLDKNYYKYFEALELYSQGTLKWGYSTSIEDIKFFNQSQEYVLSIIKD